MSKTSTFSFYLTVDGGTLGEIVPFGLHPTDIVVRVPMGKVWPNDLLAGESVAAIWSRFGKNATGKLLFAGVVSPFLTVDGEDMVSYIPHLHPLSFGADAFSQYLSTYGGDSYPLQTQPDLNAFQRSVVLEPNVKCSKPVWVPPGVSVTFSGLMSYAGQYPRAISLGLSMPQKGGNRVYIAEDRVNQTIDSITSLWQHAYPKWPERHSLPVQDVDLGGDLFNSHRLALGLGVSLAEGQQSMLERDSLLTSLSKIATALTKQKSDYSYVPSQSAAITAADSISAANDRILQLNVRLDASGPRPRLQWKAYTRTGATSFLFQDQGIPALFTVTLPSTVQQVLTVQTPSSILSDDLGNYGLITTVRASTATPAAVPTVANRGMTAGTVPESVASGATLRMTITISTTLADRIIALLQSSGSPTQLVPNVFEVYATVGSADPYMFYGSSMKSW